MSQTEASHDPQTDPDAVIRSWFNDMRQPDREGCSAAPTAARAAQRLDIVRLVMVSMQSTQARLAAARFARRPPAASSSPRR
jgi:hypothetical protein